MSKIFKADVLEACRLLIPRDRKKAKVKADIVRNLLAASNPIYAAIDQAKVLAAIRTVFPIYKNPRTRTKAFKVSHAAAKNYAEAENLVLRPLEDAMKARIGLAAEAEHEVLSVIAPLDGKDREQWDERNGRLKWRRVLVHIDEVKGDRMRITLPQWNANRSIHVPTSGFPENVRPMITPGAWLIAAGHIATTSSADVRLKDFEIAPTPDADDGLE